MNWNQDDMWEKLHYSYINTCSPDIHGKEMETVCKGN